MQAVDNTVVNFLRFLRAVIGVVSKRGAGVWVLTMLPTLVLAQPACEERLKEIDERIATGDYPEQNVQLARTMRESMAQMCGMLRRADARSDDGRLRRASAHQDRG
jgi:hypothetical protein